MRDLSVTFWCTLLGGAIAALVAGASIRAFPVATVNERVGDGLMAGGLLFALIALMFLFIIWREGPGEGRDNLHHGSSQRGNHNQSNQQNAGDNSRNVNVSGGAYHEAPSPREPSQRFIGNSDPSLGVEHGGIWWQLTTWSRYLSAARWWLVMEARCLEHKQHLLICDQSDAWVRPSTDPNGVSWSSSYADSRILKCAGNSAAHSILLKDRWQDVCALARAKLERAAEVGGWSPEQTSSVPTG